MIKVCGEELFTGSLMYEGKYRLHVLFSHAAPQQLPISAVFFYIGGNYHAIICYAVENFSGVNFSGVRSLNITFPVHRFREYHWSSFEY